MSRWLIALSCLGAGVAGGAVAAGLTLPSRYALQPVLNAALFGGAIASVSSFLLALEAIALAVRPTPWIAASTALGVLSGLIPWLIFRGPLA